MDQTRRAMQRVVQPASQLASQPAYPIVLALTAISRLSLMLSPAVVVTRYRCNRHALIMQMSLGRREPLLMSDWHVHLGYIEQRNAFRLSVTNTHARAGASERTSPIVPDLSSVASGGDVSSRPRAPIFPVGCILPRARCHSVLTEGRTADTRSQTEASKAQRARARDVTRRGGRNFSRDKSPISMRERLDRTVSVAIRGDYEYITRRAARTVVKFAQYRKEDILPGYTEKFCVSLWGHLTRARINLTDLGAKRVKRTRVFAENRAKNKN